MQKSSHSFMRNGKNSLLIYDRFDGNSLADNVREKHVGLDKKRQASEKEHVLSLRCLSQLLTQSFAGLIL